jgi:UDP-N-acetylmuramoylalanine--D-glutamate ligase
MIIDLTNKKISIIGAGRSGVSAAEIIKSRGGVPFISDNATIKDSGLASRLQALNIIAEFGGHTDKAFDCDLMIVSPAVSADADVIANAKSKGIKVWPEIELAYRLCRGKIIGITGSNGKTTTTALTGEMLKNAGLPTFVCGNIGFPFIDIAEKVPEDGYAVVELSSFQLEQIDSFHSDISVFLNLTPDHLDRHKSLDIYISAKMRIFENQAAGDLAVVNFDDEVVRESCARLVARTHWFSIRRSFEDSVWAVPDGAIYAMGEQIIKSIELKIKGEHNLSNACAAVAAAIGAGVPKNKIAETLKSFSGVEHRLEPVRLIGGVSFINDSKGTNVDSVFWALKAVSAPVILIAGGKDKAGDFSVLNDLISKKVRTIVLIGQAANKMETAWGKIVTCLKASSMDEAVRTAYGNAVSGDTVLLSPACASFDMFDNYEHRGRVFKKIVMELGPRGAILENRSE